MDSDVPEEKNFTIVQKSAGNGEATPCDLEDTVCSPDQVEEKKKVPNKPKRAKWG
jgi:hypothetical protein